MDIMQAKKLFAPPDKLDGTQSHLINMANKGFESLAMELCELAPNTKHLDEVIHELNKIRLLYVHSIGLTPTKKEQQPEIQAKAPKTPKPPKTPVEPKQEIKTDNVISDLEIDNEEEIEGFS